MPKNRIVNTPNITSNMHAHGNSQINVDTQITTGSVNYIFQLTEGLAQSSINPQKNNLIISLPFRQNIHFTGRENFLAELTQHLAEGNINTEGSIFAISGPGGIGKTQLAVQFARQAVHKNEYQLIWYLSCKSFEVDYEDLGKALGFKYGLDKRELIGSIKQELIALKKWLIIVDDVEDYEKVKVFFPGLSGHLILISHNPRLIPRPALKIENFSREESIQFIGKFLRKTREELGDYPNKLAELLVDFPLSLSQACSYLQEQINIQEYIKLYKMKRNLLWLHENPPADYQHTVAITWSLAIEKVKEKSPVAVQLLYYMAYLETTHIPLYLLSQFTGKSEAEINFEKNILLSYSLVNIAEDDKYVSIHPIMQLVIRDSLGKNQADQYLIHALLGIKEAMPNYVTEILDSSADIGVEDDKRQNIISKSKQLQRHLENVLKILEQDSNRNLVNAYFTLGMAYLTSGDFDNAVVNLNIALSRKKHIDIEYANIYFAKILACHALKDKGNIVFHLENALRTNVEMFGENSSRVLRILIMLSAQFVNDKTDLISKGFEHLQRALCISLIIHGEFHIMTACILNGLYFAHDKLGNKELADGYLNRFMNITKRLQASGDLPKGDQLIEYLKRELTRINSTYENEDHPAAILLSMKLAENYFIQERYEEAQEIQLSLENKVLNRFGRYSHEYLIILGSIARTYFRQNVFDDALNYFKEIIEIFPHVNNINSGNLGDTYHFVGRIYLETNELEEGLENLMIAAGIFISLNLQHHVFFGEIQHFIGEYYWLNENFAECIKYNEYALDVYKKNNLGVNHPLVVDTHIAIADCHYKLKANEQARTIYYNNVLRCTHDMYDRERVFVNLSKIHLQSSQYKDAEKLYVTAMQLNKDNAIIHQDAGCLFHLLGLNLNDHTFFTKAESCFLKAIELDNSATTRVEYVNFLYEQERYEEAWSHLQSLYEEDEFAEDETCFYYDKNEIHTLAKEIRPRLTIFDEIEFSAVCYAYYLGIMLNLKLEKNMSVINQLVQDFTEMMKNNENPCENELYFSAISNFPPTTANNYTWIHRQTTTNPITFVTPSCSKSYVYKK